MAIGYLQGAMELDPALSECTYSLNLVAAYDRLGDAEERRRHGAVPEAAGRNDPPVIGEREPLPQH